MVPIPFIFNINVAHDSDSFDINMSVKIKFYYITYILLYPRDSGLEQTALVYFSTISPTDLVYHLMLGIVQQHFDHQLEMITIKNI